MSKGLLKEEAMKSLSEKALEIINSPLENDPLQNEWTEVFNLLVSKLDVGVINELSLLQKVTPLFAYTMP